MKTLAAMFACAVLIGCSAQLEDYQQQTPRFSLMDYFNGQITAWGIVQDYSTRMTRHFCVDIDASWQGQQGTLDERFYFNDGEVQRRVWRLNIDDKGNVSGTAGDVEGLAQGKASGNAFNWQYTLVVPIDGSEYRFAIDDWMYQLDDTRLFNRSYMQKWGVTVAQISIFFDKTAPVRRCPAGLQ